jgi:adenylate cyclase
MKRLQELVRRGPAPGIAWPVWFQRLVSVGIVSTNPQVVRRQRFTNIVAFASAANALSHLVINWAYAPYELAIVHVYNAIFALLALLVPRLHRFGDNVAASALAFLILIGTLFVIWMLGRDSQLHVYFTLAGVMLFMFGVEHLRLFLFWFAVAFAALVVSINLAPVHGLMLAHDHALREVLAGHAMINAIVINGLTILYVLTVLRRTETELETQYARSSALVDTILPPPIAERLILGTERRIADRVENVTVLFADLVGFTNAAHDLPPDEVVEYLDGFVSSFDELCNVHGVEKIKTMGDSYMAAGGLHGASGAEAIEIGQLALAMIETQSKRVPLGKAVLALRVGIHTGRATAGIIGDTRFTYDIWGDAVNIASRMESYGVPGRIQVSEAFRRAVGDAFLFEERGAAEYKGIGLLRTYFLLSPAAAD